MTTRLRDRNWVRFLQAPDKALLEQLYVPALTISVTYDRCCAYFSSSVLAAAAAGFGPFIARILSGEIARRPTIRLVVNEELSADDVAALMDQQDEAPLIEALLARFGTPANALQKRRLEMLAWLVRDKWLDVRVGLMRQGGGILHAKFGLFTDAHGDTVTFAGSGNESARALAGNYEDLEITGSWHDNARFAHYRSQFEQLWAGTHPAVITVNLPTAVRDNLLKLAPEEVPISEAEDATARERAAMLWTYAMETPFMPDGASTCDAMAPVNMWPHQRHVVSDAAAMWPQGRLLCDEVGMGKTVQGILTLRRLLAGRGVKRVLILLPANLLQQWQEELRERGNLWVPRLDGSTVIWPDGKKERKETLSDALALDILLMSRETARTEMNLPVLLAAAPWDIVVLDEAHAARRASQVEGEFNSPTLLLGLLRRLQATGQAKGFLLLSATPMQTHPWEPWDLLQVLGEGGRWLSGFHVVRDYYRGLAALERGACTKTGAALVANILSQTEPLPAPPNGIKLPPPSEVEGLAKALTFLPTDQARTAAKWLRSATPLAQRMHRNTRRTLRRYFEMGLLDRPPPRRVVAEEGFDFADLAERDVYDAVKQYIDKRFDELEQQKPGKGFVMTIYRRRAASSPEALRLSLERRLLGLKAVIAQRAVVDDVPDLDDAEDLQDILNFKLTAALPDTPAEARQELEQVERLLDKLEAIRGLDSKRDVLIRALKKLVADGRSALVFTGYTDTMVYLRDYLVGAWGTAVASYSGDGGAIWTGSSWRSASKAQVTAALHQGQVKVLVCTDAASEGLNLQAAAAVVNFDLPWNPSKVEQRIGRIDRIGQVLEEVRVVNLYLTNSVDARVYRALAQRCSLFEEFVGAMQPVLSRAMRMLLGREHFNETELAALAEQIKNDPSLIEPFADDDEVDTQVDVPLVAKGDLGVLIGALEGSGVGSKPINDTVVELSEPALRIAIEPKGLAEDLSATYLDGLNPTLRRFAHQLWRPGERLPLVLGTSENGAFRSSHAAWVGLEGIKRIRNFAELRELVTAWNGASPALDDWLSAQRIVRAEARQEVEDMMNRATLRVATIRAQQIEAAKLRLQEELGRFLICAEPDTDDLNGKLHGMTLDGTATAARLRRVFHRLGGYPDWSLPTLQALRSFRDNMTANQIKSRLTGRELDAALDDPRWAVIDGGQAVIGAPQ
jgi:superfamily II DNA or RNA helicase